MVDEMQTHKPDHNTIAQVQEQEAVRVKQAFLNSQIFKKEHKDNEDKINCNIE